MVAQDHSVVRSDQQLVTISDTVGILLLTTMVVIASVCICIALLILTPEKQSAKWVFTEVTDGSGWGSKGFSFLLGFVFLQSHGSDLF